MTSALLVFTSHPSNSGGGSRKHGSRSASNDSLLDAADDPHASHLPNKDFRKSDLNRANYYDHESDVFDREPSPEVRRPRGHRRNDSYGKDPQVGQVTACSLFSLCLSLSLSFALSGSCGQTSSRDASDVGDSPFHVFSSPKSVCRSQIENFCLFLLCGTDK